MPDFLIILLLVIFFYAVIHTTATIIINGLVYAWSRFLLTLSWFKAAVKSAQDEGFPRSASTICAAVVAVKTFLNLVTIDRRVSGGRLGNHAWGSEIDVHVKDYSIGKKNVRVRQSKDSVDIEIS